MEEFDFATEIPVLRNPTFAQDLLAHFMQSGKICSASQAHKLSLPSAPLVRASTIKPRLSNVICSGSLIGFQNVWQPRIGFRLVARAYRTQAEATSDVWLPKNVRKPEQLLLGFRRSGAEMFQNGDVWEPRFDCTT